MTCPNCGEVNPAGKKFCSNCGAKLAMACPTCGAALEGSERFCGECGTPLQPAAAGAQTVSASGNGPVAAPASERRLVSVLFADLVGFTSLSEQRDAEEVRELLTRYFDTARQIIGRYGGNVEKFIGDAVMAVWGTPIAQEDDAERAVRAALDLTVAVSALGAEVGAQELSARAGVTTGEAAVTIGAEGQGMVAGDIVNTASRVQSVASPGSALVDDVTRRSTEAAISYEDGGIHELKGKTEPMQLWRAAAVVAARGGALRSVGLEPPFVGRDRDMRLVKELFHSTAEERKAHLVSVLGVAGVGKTRLSWEFEKYIDGVTEEVWWHRGRCLAYGEGVAYWALAEMLKMRAEIAEDDDPESALAKLRATISEHVSDPEEQRWLEPRLTHLLGIEERGVRDRQDLFSAWRLFFERLSEKRPTVLVFEDLQWADAALMDFIEYLLEWSRDHAIFVITLARPELSDRRPNWGAGKRNVTSLFLEPLSESAMDEMLKGLVPGLPDELRAKIRERAEGVPLYAVETVRMLLDRGLLKQEGNRYLPTREVVTLDVPETLHALIAARLDGLGPEERRLLQDAAVLGKVFTRAGIAALANLTDPDLDALLASLTRKDILSVQADPRSPERGQYGFLQDLVRHVAYETLSKRERKSRHLAVASVIEAGLVGDETEFAEILASHYLDAFQSAPDAPDAGEIRGKAREALANAGQRAASLAATEEAQRYFEQAAEMAEDPVTEGGLLESAGQMARVGGKTEASRGLFERAIALFEEAGETHAAARVSASLGRVVWEQGQITSAVERMEGSFALLSADEPDEDLAALAAELGRLHYFTGRQDLAAERIEQALKIAETLGHPGVLSEALNTKSLILFAAGRPEEALALLRHALYVALENDIPTAASRAYFNLSNLLYYHDRFDGSIEYAREGLAMARKFGDRNSEWALLAELTFVLFLTGEWDDALTHASEIPHLEGIVSLARYAAAEVLMGLPLLYIGRGQIDAARDAVAQFETFERSSDIQERMSYMGASAAVLRAQGKHADAVIAGSAAVEGHSIIGGDFPGVRLGFVEATESALELGDLDTAEQLLAVVDGFGVGDSTPGTRAQSLRLHARLADARGELDAVEQGFKAAAGLLREIGIPFWLAITELERAEWLLRQGRPEDARRLLDEPRETFERLQAQPWSERVQQAMAQVGAVTEGAR